MLCLLIVMLIDCLYNDFVIIRHPARTLSYKQEQITKNLKTLGTSMSSVIQPYALFVP